MQVFGHENAKFHKICLNFRVNVVKWSDDVQVGELTYQRTTSERMIIDHTHVFEGFEGQGIARQLVMATVDFARQNGRTIVPVCSYARNVLTRTNEYKDILA